MLLRIQELIGPPAGLLSFSQVFDHQRSRAPSPKGEAANAEATM